MDAELLALCKQTVTRTNWVSHDDHNDFSWQTDVTNQSFVLSNLVGVIVHLGIMTGTLVVKDATDVTTYSATTDYEFDYTTGELKRRTGSTIVSGSTVHVTYSWQTVSTFLARVEYNNIVMREQNGQQFISTCQIYCEQITDLDERDKLTLPTGTLVSQPEIKHIQHNPDEYGNIDHIVIYVG